MSKEQIAKIIATEDLIEKANLIIEMFRQKPSGFLSLSEVYGIKPLNRTEMDLVVDLLLKEGCEFTEKNAGIDLKKLAYAPTIIKVPDSKEPETIEEFFEEKKVEVEPLDIHPSFHDPSEAMVFDINEKVNGIAFYLTNKPCYQLSALTGDIEHHTEGWIKNPAHYWLIEELKKRGFRVESSDLRNRRNYKFYTVYSKEPKVAKPIEPVQPQKTEDEIIAEKSKNKKMAEAAVTKTESKINPEPNKAEQQAGHSRISLTMEECPLVKTSMPFEPLEYYWRDPGVASIKKITIPESAKSVDFDRLEVLVDGNVVDKIVTPMSQDTISENKITTEAPSKKSKKEKVEEVAAKEFDEDPNHAKELHEELQEMHELIKRPWSGQHEELKRHIAILSVKYARLTEMKIDAETACIRKNAAFGRENKTAELKQYQYKDQQLAYGLQEDRLHRAIDGLLKVISKQLDVLITLISTSRTEMSLAIRNHGGNA